MKRFLAVLISAAMATGCAASAATRVQTEPATRPENARAMLEAAGKIPAGSHVNLALADGRRLKAVLLAVDQGHLVVQERTRWPEPPLRIDPGQIAYLELDTHGAGLGKMVAIGAAIGAGVTLAFLAILAAALND